MFGCCTRIRTRLGKKQALSKVKLVLVGMVSFCELSLRNIPARSTFFVQLKYLLSDALSLSV